jgi:putative transposase
MRTSRCSDEQSVGMLKEHAAGEAIGTVCRRQGISQPTRYRGKAHYDGWAGKARKRLKTREAEHARLKRLVAAQALDTPARKARRRTTW